VKGIIGKAASRRYDHAMRTCARSGCSSPAAAVLTYDRTTQTAYLYAVDDPSSRTPGDLCERHLSRFVVPRSWQLIDRRESAPVEAATPLRAVSSTGPDREPKPRVAKPRVAKPRAAKAIAAKPRAVTTRKWAEVGPSLFDAPVHDVVAPSPADAEPAPSEPVWMPRFGPDSELEGVLDAKTPLLRRAFGNR
jgi:hypothetical protein